MLQLVLREFYTKSTAWRDVVGPYPVTTDPYVGLNPVDQNRYLQFVLEAYLFPYEQSNSPQELIPLTRKPVGGTPQPPSRYYMERPDLMLLNPTPDKNYGTILFAYGALIPTTTAAILPDYAYTQHVDALMFGTLARLYGMPKKSWSSKEQQMENTRKFRMEILMARDIANRGYGPGNTSMRFPVFAGRGGSQVLPRATG